MSYLTAGWLYAITGSFLIGAGGFLTTKGWHEFSNHDARQTLISAAVRELEQNDMYLRDMDTAHEQISSSSQVYLLPTFHFNSIQAIYTSPLFSNRDSGTLAAASSFLYNVNPTNDSILKLNIIFSGRDPLEHKKETYIAFFESPLLARLRRRHESLREQLPMLD